VTQLQLLADWNGVIINIICWTSFVFPAALATFWPWHESDWGKILVSLDLCIGLSVLGVTIQHDWGYPHFLMYEFGWLSTLSLTAIPIIGIWRAVMIWRKQRAAVAAKFNEPAPCEHATESERLQFGNRLQNYIVSTLHLCYP
jgi:hypothetical protein